MLRRPSRRTGTVRRFFLCHGDALKSLAFGNAGLRMMSHRKAGLRMMSHRKRVTTMTAPRPRSPQPKQLDAGILQAEISSFALRLAAEGKAAKTIRTYTEAVIVRRRPPRPGQLGAGRSQDIQRWMAWLLNGHSAYASNQYRGPAAVLQMAGRRRRATRPDERAAAAARHRQATVFTGGGLSRLGAGVRGPQLRPAPRHPRLSRCSGHRHPAGGAGWHPLRRR